MRRAGRRWRAGLGAIAPVAGIVIGAVVFTAAGLAAFGLAASAAAETAGPRPASERAAEMLLKAEAALSAARTPKERLAALGRAAQAEEAAMRALRGDLREAGLKQRRLTADLAARERRLSAVLAALARVERAPRAALAAHPGGALSAARAGLALGAMEPALAAEAARLREDLSHIASASTRISALRGRLRASLAGLRAARGEVAALIDADREAEATPPALARRIQAEAAALARSAADLGALAAAAPAAPGPTATGFAAAKGALIPPVEGALIGLFGAGGGAGVAISAPAYAEIYAPWRGAIRFAGPFGDDGVVVILEPGDDHLLIFSGLAFSRRRAGETVAAGEPLGLLAGPSGADEEFLISSVSAVEAAGPETLYMELRQGGVPVDPAAWFAFGKIER